MGPHQLRRRAQGEAFRQVVRTRRAPIPVGANQVQRRCRRQDGRMAMPEVQNRQQRGLSHHMVDAAAQGRAALDDQGAQRSLEQHGLQPAVELEQHPVDGGFRARIEGADRLEIAGAQWRGKSHRSVDFFEPQRQGALLRPAGGDPEVAVGQDTDAGPVDPPSIGIPERDQAPRGQSGSRMCDERCERGTLFGREPHHAQAQGGLFKSADWGGVHALARGFAETLRYNLRSVYRNILSRFSVRPMHEIRVISPKGISLSPDGHCLL
ncbi:MAG: hypothetical protein BWX79_03102 [Alphaproteobacteria bacterium ADurb.Bin100]|nr:MAG: hypothetical protein BWX79_03102 [Alphaproteobacteria bacterium ADurb.Bin100]